MSDLLLQFFSLQEWTGFCEFFRTIKFEIIYFVCDSSLDTVESPIVVIWHYIKHHTVRLLLLGRIHLLKYASRKTYSLRNLSLKEKVIPCLVILGLYWLKRQSSSWKFAKKPRKIALLSKGSDQSSVNRNLKDIEKNILSKLQQDLRNENIHLEENSWKQALDNGQRPVIVFCVISSRIGTDIENAMRGVNGNSQVVLVLLHCVLSSLLRGELSDDEELLDPTMKNRMSGIAHFAFSDREGLYDCQQNSVGFGRLRYTISFLPP